MSSVDPSDLEYQSLEVHVDKCSLRYEQMEKKLADIDKQFTKIDKRFDKIDERMDRIEHEYKKGQVQVIVSLLGATATIIAAFIGVIGYLQ